MRGVQGSGEVRRQLENGDCIWQPVTLVRAAGVDADNKSLVGRTPREKGTRTGDGKQRSLLQGVLLSWEGGTQNLRHVKSGFVRWEEKTSMLVGMISRGGK